MTSVTITMITKKMKPIPPPSPPMNAGFTHIDEVLVFYAGLIVGITIGVIVGITI